MGGQTFAKYITTDNATAQATVAKWGLVVNVNADSMIPNGTKTANPNANGVIVTAHSGIVYPGQSGNISMTLSGSAEVNATLSIDLGSWKEVTLFNGSDVTYNPIEWTLTDNGVNVSVTDENSDGRISLAEISSYFNNFATTNASIAAGTTLNHKFVLSWAWDFNANDKYDTYLGNIAEGLTKSTYGDDADLTNFKANSNLDLYVGFDVTITQAAA